MTTRKWALRVIAASVFFTAIICLSAPANALQAPMTQVQAEAFVKQEATCYVMAGWARLYEQQQRHAFNLSEFKESHVVAISNAMGFVNGWMEAVEVLTGVSVYAQAVNFHEYQCLEQA